MKTELLGTLLFVPLVAISPTLCYDTTKEVRKMTDLFYNISDKDKERIFKYLEASTVTYPKGINIMSNINTDNIIGVVQSGCIQIIRNDYDG